MGDETETDDTETQTDDTETEGGSDGGSSRHDRHLAKARQERDAEKERNRKLEAELAQYRKAEKDKEREKARKEQDISKIETRYQQELAERDAKIKELEEQGTARDRRDRRRSFAAEIAKVGGVSNLKLLERAMDDLPDHGIEVEPEKVSTGDVAAAIKVLKREAPELFGAAQTTPKPPGRPGLNPKNLNKNEAPGGPEKGTPEWYRLQGELASRQGGMPPGYAAATGRAPKE